MTLDEAKLIAKAMEEIDSGCPHCIDEMCNRMNKAFPEFRFYRNLDYNEIGEDVLVESKQYLFKF